MNQKIGPVRDVAREFRETIPDTRWKQESASGATQSCAPAGREHDVDTATRETHEYQQRTNLQQERGETQKTTTTNNQTNYNHGNQQHMAQELRDQLSG